MSRLGRVLRSSGARDPWIRHSMFSIAYTSNTISVDSTISVASIISAISVISSVVSTFTYMLVLLLQLYGTLDSDVLQAGKTASERHSFLRTAMSRLTLVSLGPYVLKLFH